MENGKFHWHKVRSSIVAPLIFGIALGINKDAKAQEPFCTPDDLCVEVKGRVTGYTPLSPDGILTGQCQEPCNITASGEPVMFGRTAACPTHVPFGVQVHIESEGKAGGKTYTCLDHGDMRRTDVDIAVNHENDDPNLYTDNKDTGLATIIFKFGKRPEEPLPSNFNVFSREYVSQPEGFSVQVPTFSR